MSQSQTPSLRLSSAALHSSPFSRRARSASLCAVLSKNMPTRAAPPSSERSAALDRRTQRTRPSRAILNSGAGDRLAAIASAAARSSCGKSSGWQTR